MYWVVHRGDCGESSSTSSLLRRQLCTGWYTEKTQGTRSGETERVAIIITELCDNALLDALIWNGMVY